MSEDLTIIAIYYAFGWFGFAACAVLFMVQANILNSALREWRDTIDDLGAAVSLASQLDEEIRELRAEGDEWKEAK